MALDLLFGFLVLVTASYIGTTMALRGYFGRERPPNPRSVLTPDDMVEGDTDDE